MTKSNKLSLLNRYFEAISNQAISLSLSNLPGFYSSYIKRNSEKVKSELDRVGYFALKNKVSIGNSSATTKDIFISAYFINMEMEDECNKTLHNKYHSEADVRTVGGFFLPSTNEVVVIIKVNNINDIEGALKRSDIRSTIEHELTHAFDSTNKKSIMSKQNTVPGVGENFLSMCAYLGCANKSEIAQILGHDYMSDGEASACLYSISIILYKLFTVTEFNAHQMSDLEETHNVNIKRSDAVKKALKRDVLNDLNLTERQLINATLLDDEDCPELWSIVGKVLNYIGYKVNYNSPKAVYKFFTRMSEKLFNKYYKKKLKNQVKQIISLREKNNIKEKLAKCIDDNELYKGISFWFSPSGSSDSFLCRVNSKSSEGGNLNIYINKEPIKIVGNANAMLNRVMSAISNKEQFDFALDNLIDVIVQSIERHFKNVGYDPVYDITMPQDEDQISKSNKVANRFADLDWD